MANKYKKAHSLVEVEAEQFFSDKPLPFSPKSPCQNNGNYWYVENVYGQILKLVDSDWVLYLPNTKSYYVRKDEEFKQEYSLIKKEKKETKETEENKKEVKRPRESKKKKKTTPNR